MAGEVEQPVVVAGEVECVPPRLESAHTEAEQGEPALHPDFPEVPVREWCFPKELSCQNHKCRTPSNRMSFPAGHVVFRIEDIRTKSYGVSAGGIPKATLKIRSSNSEIRNKFKKQNENDQNG